MQVLELRSCSLLTSVSLDLPRLKNIRLAYCRKYVSASFSLSPEKHYNSIIDLSLSIAFHFLFKSIANPFFYTSV